MTKEETVHEGNARARCPECHGRNHRLDCSIGRSGASVRIAELEAWIRGALVELADDVRERGAF